MVNFLAQNLTLALIRLYQKTLSPDHGLGRYFYPQGACIYRPTCSEYAFESIRRFGVGRGVIMSAKRLARCHPWHEPGYDPLEIIKTQETRYKQDTIINI